MKKTQRENLNHVPEIHFDSTSMADPAAALAASAIDAPTDQEWFRQNPTDKKARTPSIAARAAKRRFADWCKNNRHRGTWSGWDLGPRDLRTGNRAELNL